MYHSTVRADLPSERLWTSKCRVRVLRSKKLSQKSRLPPREKVRMRGIVSVTLTSILSHTGRGEQGRCFEIVSNLSWSMPRIRAIRPVTPVQLPWSLLASLGENCLVGKQWELEPEDRIRQRIGKGFWQRKCRPNRRFFRLKLSQFVAVVASQAGFEPATRCLEGRGWRFRCLGGNSDTNIFEKPTIFAARQ